MAKNNSTKGAKKSRRFKRPRSFAAIDACAIRKNLRRKAQAEREKINKARGYTAWDEAKKARYDTRH